VERSQEAEIMDDPDCPPEVLEAGHRDLMRIHRWLGNLRAVAGLIVSGGAGGPGSKAVRRILDVGCGQGAAMRELARRLGVEAIGVDLRSWPGVLVRDATRDPLPDADVAISLYVAHHLSGEDLVKMIRNVRRSCPRFIILDLVRHPLPLWLFRGFVAPFVCDVVVHDGAVSVRRAFTPGEMNRLVAEAVNGGPFSQHVAPFYTRQVIEI
jgi:SAM-dependent methyltransferase